jgi:hypothetical protein
MSEPTTKADIVLEDERVFVLARCDLSPYADVRSRNCYLRSAHSNLTIKFYSVRQGARLRLYEELVP